MAHRFALLLAATLVASSGVGAEELIAGRYRIGDAGLTVTDLQTGLMWQRCQLGLAWTPARETCIGPERPLALTWDAAMAYRSDLAGYADWRLPKKDELKSLVLCSTGPATPLPDHSVCNPYSRPTIHFGAFPGTRSSFMWSATPDLDRPDDMWGVEFADGQASSGYRGNLSEVRLVRGVPKRN